MPKKENSKMKKDDTDDDPVTEHDEIDADADLDMDEEEQYESDEEIVENDKDELIIDGDVIASGCIINDTIEADELYFESNEEIEVPSEQGVEYVSKENRISINRLTKYEMVRILGERTKQLTMGAKPLVKNYQTLPYDKIAEEELVKNMIPYKIKRPLPNGKYEIWTLDELEKEHLLSQLESI